MTDLRNMKIVITPKRFSPRPPTMLRPRLDGKPRGPGTPRPAALADVEEGRMSDAQLEFITAMDRYKRKHRRPWPTLTETLDVLRSIGYRKVLPREIPLDAPHPPLERPD